MIQRGTPNPLRAWSTSTAPRATKNPLTASYAIARTLPEIRAALGLVYAAYWRQGFVDQNPFQQRVIPQHVSASAEVLIARLNDHIAASVTLVPDTPEGRLPLEATFPREVQARRRGGRILAEASCLAHDPDRRPPLSVVVRTMAMVIQLAKYRGADELLAAVHPHHLDFYTGFLGFEPFGEVKTHRAVRHHPAAAISLDLHGLAAKHPQAYRRVFLPPFDEETLRYRPLTEEARQHLQMVLDGQRVGGRFAREAAGRHV